MSERLPVRVNAYRLAESGERLEGSLTCDRMERLKELLVEEPLDVVCSLNFGKVGNKLLLSGNIKAEPVITCQRCLEPMRYKISNSFELSLVESNEQATRELSEHEPYLLTTDELLEISDFLEDEILLSLPGYPRHEHNCTVPGNRTDTSENTLERGEEPNPFSVLEQLKNKD